MTKIAKLIDRRGAMDPALPIDPWYRTLITAPKQQAAREIARHLADRAALAEHPEDLLTVLDPEREDPRFWSALVDELGPEALAELVGRVGRPEAAGDGDSIRLAEVMARGVALAFDNPDLETGWQNRFLDRVAWNDLRHLVERAGLGGRLAGHLAARLVELGHNDAARMASNRDEGDYAETMRRLKTTLEGDARSRRTFATHPRSFARPADHPVNEADAWVVPMIERELRRLPASELTACRLALIGRIGRQGYLHPDFRPLLLRLGTEDELLALLAMAGKPIGGGAGPASAEHPPSRQMAPERDAAEGFVAVLMTDPDEGIELEAAVWDYVQRIIERAAAAADGRDLPVAIGAATALLRLLAQARRRSGDGVAHGHAAAAVKAAVAEFVLVNARLLWEKPEQALSPGGRTLRRAVLREFDPTPGITIPDGVLEAFAAGRSAVDLLRALALIALAAHQPGHRRALRSGEGSDPLACLERLAASLPITVAHLAGPRIEQAVEQIGQKVEGDEHRPDHDRAAEHGVHVGIL
jgi:hypothetical protein